LWAIGRYDLGLSEEDFWELTFCKFHALCKRKQIDDKLLDFRSGVIACTIANVHRKAGSKAYTPEDFMPSLKTAKKPKSAEQLRKQLEAWFPFTDADRRPD
jgi:hypothetical protein